MIMLNFFITSTMIDHLVYLCVFFYKNRYINKVLYYFYSLVIVRSDTLYILLAIMYFRRPFSMLKLIIRIVICY